MSFPAIIIFLGVRIEVCYSRGRDIEGSKA
jgi:hypothetical protein